MEADPRWWTPGIFAVVLGAIALRLAFGLMIAPDLPVPGDAVVYREMAFHLAEGDGFVAVGIDTDAVVPTAEHPPLFPALLAAFDLVGLGSIALQRAALAVLSGAGVSLIALVGRRVGGPAVGLVAAALAAAHPLWVQPAGMVMSESLHLVLVAAVLLAGLTVLDDPTPRRAGLLGVLVGLAALNRPESLGYLAVVALPVVLLAKAARGRRLRLLAVTGLACVAVVLPWVMRNQVQTGSPVMATNSGKTLLGSNCNSTYAGPHLGGFDPVCALGSAGYLIEVGRPGGGRWDGLSLDQALGDVGEQYVRDHLDELPKVVVARVARLWSLAFQTDQLQFEIEEGRHRPMQHLGQWVHLALLPLTTTGAVLMVRGGRGREAILLLGIPLLVTASMLLVYGGPRMRIGAEPAIAVFAAVALVPLASSARRWLRRDPGGDDVGR